MDRIRHALGAYPLTILAVTKKQPLERIQEAIHAGVRVFGNNYVQEGRPLIEKFPELEWHFIGHIQSRKAKELGDYRLVESVDRVAIAEVLSRRAEASGRVHDILVEVNIGKEPQKSGVLPEDLPSFLNAVSDFKGIRIRGLMGMPPPIQPVDLRAPYFAALRKLFDQSKWDTLSMGTSEDYRVAAAEGSTLVRLGTALFGERKI